MTSNNGSNITSATKDALAQKINQMMEMREMLQHEARGLATSNQLVSNYTANNVSDTRLQQQQQQQQQCYVFPNAPQLQMPNVQPTILGCNNQGHVYIVNNNMGYGNTLAQYQLGNIQNQYVQNNLHYPPNASLPPIQSFHQNQFTSQFNSNSPITNSAAIQDRQGPQPASYGSNTIIPGVNQMSSSQYVFPVANNIPEVQRAQVTQAAGSNESHGSHYTYPNFNQFNNSQNTIQAAICAPQAQPAQIYDSNFSSTASHGSNNMNPGFNQLSNSGNTFPAAIHPPQVQRARVTQTTSVNSTASFGPNLINSSFNQFNNSQSVICEPHVQSAQINQTAAANFISNSSGGPNLINSGSNQFRNSSNAMSVANSAPQIIHPIPNTTNLHSNAAYAGSNITANSMHPQTQETTNYSIQQRPTNEETSLFAKNLPNTSTVRPIKPKTLTGIDVITIQPLNPRQTISPAANVNKNPMSISSLSNAGISRSILNSNQQQSQLSRQQSSPVTVESVKPKNIAFQKIAPKPQDCPNRSIARMPVIVRSPHNYHSPVTQNNSNTIAVAAQINPPTIITRPPVITRLPGIANTSDNRNSVNTNLNIAIATHALSSSLPAPKIHIEPIILQNKASEGSSTRRDFESTFENSLKSKTAITKETAVKPAPNISKILDQSKTTATPKKQLEKAHKLQNKSDTVLAASISPAPVTSKTIQFAAMQSQPIASVVEANKNENNIRSTAPPSTAPIASTSALENSLQMENIPATNLNVSKDQKQCSNERLNSSVALKTVNVAASSKNPEFLETKKELIEKVGHFLQGSVEESELNRILSLINRAGGQTGMATGVVKKENCLIEKPLAKTIGKASPSTECESVSAATNIISAKEMAEAATGALYQRTKQPKMGSAATPSDPLFEPDLEIADMERESDSVSEESADSTIPLARRRTQKKKSQEIRKKKRQLKRASTSDTMSDTSFIQSDASSEESAIPTADTSDSNYDEFKSNMKTIGKRIRKRRRSCTARAKYYESDGSDYWPIDARSKPKAPIASTSTESAAISPLIEPDISTESDYLPPENPPEHKSPKSNNLKRKSIAKAATPSKKARRAHTKIESIPKNTNPEVYPSNPRYKFGCMLCETTTEHYGYHYIVNHPDREAYISRLSPEIMQMAIDGTLPFSEYSIRSYIQGICLFCEKTIAYQRDKWLEHFSLHMGHQVYECCHCAERYLNNTAMPVECRKSKHKQILKATWDNDGNIYAFACKLCNYVRFIEENIIKHLENEHELNDKAEMVLSVQKITLIKVATAKPDEPQPSAEKNASIVKNTNIELYASNPQYKSCIICGLKPRNCAIHYAKFHPDTEVYTSRLSPKMIQLGIDGNQMAEKFSFGKFKTICLFCERNHKKGKHTWLEHYANHMGHYLYECSKCWTHINDYSRHKTECSTGINILIKPEWNDNILNGYACRLCNYAQLLKENICRHLISEHELNDNIEINESITKIALLTIPKTLPKVLKEQLQILPMFKNTNAEMYASNPLFNKHCVICDAQPLHLLNHYATDHASYAEVYIARMSPKMLQMATAGKLNIKNVNNTCQLICYFCEKIFNKLTRRRCLEHYACHMGHLLYTCSKCSKSFNNSSDHRWHCSGDYKQIIQLTWKENYLYGFLCKLCNYIQLTEENLIKHLINEHELSDNTNNELAVNIQEIMLLNAPLFNCNNEDDIKTTSKSIAGNDETDIGNTSLSTVETDNESQSAEIQSSLELKELKNTNIEMYASNPRYDRQCVLCHMKVMKNHCISHYTKIHPNSEAFISRMSTKMMQRATEGNQIVKKLPMSKLKATCLVCEQILTKTHKQWMQHYATDLGQYLYKCNKCRKSFSYIYSHKKSCKNCTYREILKLTLADDILHGFACHLCNYVQLTKENIRKHLKNEHELAAADVDDNVKLITLFRPNPSNNKINQEVIDEISPRTTRNSSANSRVTRSLKLKNRLIQRQRRGEQMRSAAPHRRSTRSSQQSAQTSATPKPMTPTPDQQSTASTKTPSKPEPQNLTKCIKQEEATEVIPNIDSEMYASNVRFNKNCVLCGVEDGIFHYPLAHPKSEVYISRLSARMMKIAIAGKQSVKCLEHGTVKTICLFCGRNQEFTRRRWLDHYACHMGLYLYECKTCCTPLKTSKSFRHGNCKKPIHQQIISPVWDDNALYSFACKLCNYMHLVEKKIVRHLIKEHDLMNSDKITQHILKITLLNVSQLNCTPKNLRENHNDSDSDPNTEVNQPIETDPLSDLIDSNIELPAQVLIKNDKKEMYAKNSKYLRDCVVCGQRVMHPVIHYVRQHTEVYISRISQRILKQITIRKPRSVLLLDHRLRAFCPFCECNLSLRESRWIDHFTTHTGEFQYTCNKCQHRTSAKLCHVRTKCGGRATGTIIDINIKMDANALYGFQCTICNYVQLSEQRVLDHIKVHDNMNENIIGDQCQQITLLDLGYKGKSAPLANDLDDQVSAMPTATVPTTPTTSTTPITPTKPITQKKKQNTCILSDDANEKSASCISAKMFKLLQNDTPKILRVPNRSLYTILCVFCESPQSIRKSQWVQHFSKHTGEYKFECAQCDRKTPYPHRHNGKCEGQIAKLKKIHNFDIDNNFILAYICKQCNFVQLSITNIRKHIQSQHGISAIELSGQLQMVKLCEFVNAIEMEYHLLRSMYDKNQLRSSNENQMLALPKINILEIPAVRNNQKQHHSYDYTDDEHKIDCVLCANTVYVPSLSFHFDVRHPNDEFFYSRVTQCMMDRIKDDDLPKSYKKISSNERLKTYAFCPFCDRFVSSDSSSNWRIHLARHTNEDLFACEKCDETFLWTDKHLSANQLCKASDVKQIFKIDDDGEVIYGFACNLCNFIQLQWERAIRHLQYQHNINDLVTITDSFSRVKLMNLEQEEHSLNGPIMLKELRIVLERYQPTKDQLKQISHLTNADNTEPQYSQVTPKETNESHDLGIKICSVASDILKSDTETNNVPTDDEQSMDLCFMDVQQGANNEIETLIPAQSSTDTDDGHNIETMVTATAGAAPFDDDVEFDYFLITSGSDDDVSQFSNKTIEYDATDYIKTESIEDADQPQPSTSTGCVNTNRFAESKPFISKPWIEGATTKGARLLDDVALFAPYKCMSTLCYFTTALPEQMTKHLIFHEKKFYSAVIKPEIKDYLECAYCTDRLETVIGLIEHIDATHGDSIFQCSFCFYRSVDAYSVEIHLKNYHADREKIILICNGFDAATLEHQLTNVISEQCEHLIPVKCEECAEKERSFFVIDHYIWHMKYVHKQNKFHCFQCNLNLPIEKVKVHFNCHNIGDFNCLYCAFGVMSADRMAVHMADKHSDKLMFAVARYYQSDSTSKTIAESDRGLILIVNLATALDPTNCDIRFRELELKPDNLNFMSVTNVNQMISSNKRNMDTRANKLSPRMTNILKEYTFRESVCQIVTINELNDKYMNAAKDKVYEELEQILDNFKGDTQ